MNVPLGLEKIITEIKSGNSAKEAALAALEKILYARGFTSYHNIKTAKNSRAFYEQVEKELRHHLAEESELPILITEEHEYTRDCVRVEMSTVVIHPNIAQYLRQLIRDMGKEIATLKKQLEDVHGNRA